MDWHIFYKGKAYRNTLTENLVKAGVEFYLPVKSIEFLEDEQMKVREEGVMKNLIFIKTDLDAHALSNAIDGLRAPYVDRSTGKPAVVPDAEMHRFMKFLEYSNMKAQVLSDPFQRFRVFQKVRVKAGDFAGIEGYVLRIRGDRKLIVSLGNMAIAVSGIHHTLFEPIEE